MSNTQRPKAAMNGQGTQHRPGQIEILSVIAGGVQALAQDATRKPAAQRWHCALCLGRLKAWESRHAGDMQALVTAYQEQMAAFGKAMNDPAVSDDDKQRMLAAQPNLQMMCAAYGEQAGDPMPAVNEAGFIITTPELGTVAVCATEVPPVNEGPRRALLAAAGPLSSAMVAAVRSGL